MNRGNFNDKDDCAIVDHNITRRRTRNYMKSIILEFAILGLLIICSCQSNYSENNSKERFSDSLKIIYYNDNKTQEEIDNYTVNSHDVYIYEQASMRRLNEFEPLKKDTSYKIIVSPIDSNDILEKIDFPYDKVKHTKVNDSTFSMEILNINDTIIGIQSFIRRKKGKYLICLVNNRDTIRTVVSGIGGFEYYKVKF
jgi:hypothetical protein